MSSDDYDDRQRGSSDCSPFRQEQLNFEEILERRRDAVSEAFPKKRYSKVASWFGFDPSGSSGVFKNNSKAFETRDRPRTAYEQFLKHKTRLIIKLEASLFLPARVTQQWVRKIKQLDLFQPSSGLMELDELYTDYLYAVDQYNPRHEHLEMAVSKTTEFESEMYDLMQELDWLKAILKHVEV